MKGNGDLVRSRQRILNLKVCAVDLERDIFLALIAKQLCGVGIAAVQEDQVFAVSETGWTVSPCLTVMAASLGMLGNMTFQTFVQTA